MSDLQRKVVFVTGSARRLGRAIALAFAEAGANLVIHYANSSSEADAHSAARAAESYGAKTLIITGDQAQSDDVQQMFAQVKEHFGRLDVMVNSASVFKRKDFLEIDEAEWDFVLDTNLKGPFLLSQSAARLMKDNGGGVIINISDNSGINGWVSRPHHSISKAGVIMLTQLSALALAKYGIRVNCVVPGPVLAPADADASVLEEIAAALPIGHIGEPRNIADACLFLSHNPFATGSILRLDGGEALVGGET